LAAFKKLQGNVHGRCGAALPGEPGFIRMGKEESRTFRGFVREKLDFCEVFNIFHLPFIMITITVKKGSRIQPWQP